MDNFVSRTKTIKADENIHDFEILLLLDSGHRFFSISIDSDLNISGPRAMVCWKSSRMLARQHQSSPVQKRVFKETIHRCVVLKIVSTKFELRSQILDRKYIRRSSYKNSVYKTRDLTSIFDVNRRFYRHYFIIDVSASILLLDF